MDNHILIDPIIEEICHLEYQITVKIQRSSRCHCHFDYDQKNQNLRIVTYNYYHKATFLFGNFQGETYIKALTTVMDYLEKIYPDYHNYSVTWHYKNDHKQYVSYFKGASEDDARGKLYCSVQNISNIKIDSVVLSPIS